MARAAVAASPPTAGALFLSLSAPRGSGDHHFVRLDTYPKFEGYSLEEFDKVGRWKGGTVGLSDCRTAGLPDCRTAGLPDCRTVGGPAMRMRRLAATRERQTTRGPQPPFALSSTLCWAWPLPRCPRKCHPALPLPARTPPTPSHPHPNT
jgi:hypothetical protein